MRKTLIALLLSMGLIGVGAAPADAASTRAEYIAQVDPICQTFVGPVNDAGSTWLKNVKRLVRVAKSGTVKAIVRQTRRTAGSQDQFAQVDARLTDQIAAVPPAAADAGVIGTWLNGRRQADGLLVSSASALNHFKFRMWLKRLKAAAAAADAASGAVSGFGFQVCGVRV